MSTDPRGSVHDPYLGVTLADRYLVRQRIGVGGMGYVYEAEHQLIGRRVAVKILNRRVADDPELLRRFMNEARAMGTLRHPNIVESYDVSVTPDGVPFVVLEFLEGHSLARELALQGALPLDRAVRIVVQVAAALAAAHHRGIVHRDIKPGNIFLLDDGMVKVLDFGISKFDDSDIGESGGSRPGSIMGSPNYMAPEQVFDPDGVDARADIYSLGAVLYEMLSGVMPFADVGYPRILKLVTEQEPKAVETLCSGLDPSIAAIVRRAMAKDPNARFQSAAEFASEMLSCVSTVSSVMQSPYGTFSEAGFRVPTTPVPAAHVSSHAPPNFWQEWRVPLMAGTALAVVIAVLWLAFAGREPTQPTASPPVKGKGTTMQKPAQGAAPATEPTPPEQTPARDTATTPKSDTATRRGDPPRPADRRRPRSSALPVHEKVPF